MKEQILELRSKGLSYRAIQEELGCSKATISYHVGEGQKEKFRVRRNNSRRGILSQRIPQTKKDKALQRAVYSFQVTTDLMTFNSDDVIDKFGYKTTCYLTGTPIDLRTDEFHFDHIVPISKNGSSTLDNLGITTRDANMGKGRLTIEQFLEMCEKVLMHHGYRIQHPD